MMNTVVLEASGRLADRLVTEDVYKRQVYVDGKAAQSLPVVTAEGSARMDFTYFLHRVLEGFFHTEVQM